MVRRICLWQLRYCLKFISPLPAPRHFLRQVMLISVINRNPALWFELPGNTFHALEKEMATHSSVLAWRIPGTGEPGGLRSMGSHRVGHDWSDLAAAAAAAAYYYHYHYWCFPSFYLVKISCKDCMILALKSGSSELHFGLNYSSSLFRFSSLPYLDLILELFFNCSSV